MKGMKEEAMSGVGGRGSIVEKARKSHPTLEKEILHHQREKMSMRMQSWTQVRREHSAVQRACVLNPNFSEWLLPGEKCINSCIPNSSLSLILRFHISV